MNQNKHKWLLLLLITIPLIISPPINSIASPGGGVTISQPVTLSGQLCDLRLMFCGQTAYVIMMLTLVIIGLLIFSGRVTWTFVLLMFAAGAIFVSAERVAALLIGYGVNCNCGGIFWLFNNPNNNLL